MRTGLRDARREGAARRAPADVPLDARVALAARVGNQGLLRLLAREPAATEAPAIPAWVTGLYTMVGLSAAEVTALLNAAGPSALGHFTRAYHFGSPSSPAIRWPRRSATCCSAATSTRSSRR